MNSPELRDSAFVTVSLGAAVPVLFMSSLFIENCIFEGEGDEVYRREEASAGILVTCQSTQFHGPDTVNGCTVPQVSKHMQMPNLRVVAVGSSWRLFQPQEGIKV